MKKNILFRILLCALALMLALPAFAEEAPQYALMQDFVRVLEENDLTYTYKGIIDSGEERLLLSFTQDIYENFTFDIFVPEAQNRFSLRLWSLVTVNSGKTYALQVVNDLNNSWKYAKFVLDESDNTINVELDNRVASPESGEAMLGAIISLCDILVEEECQEKILSLR